MYGLSFEWDETKDAGNERKLGASFAEASTAFNDPLSITVADPAHGADEETLCNHRHVNQEQSAGSGPYYWERTSPFDRRTPCDQTREKRL
jgi:hypothetical protein